MSSTGLKVWALAHRRNRSHNRQLQQLNLQGFQYRLPHCRLCSMFPSGAKITATNFILIISSNKSSPKAVGMGGCLSLPWKQRAIEETRALCTGIFVTAVLARVIANLGFDKRPTPILPISGSFNAEVLPFVFFVVRPQVEFRVDFL